MTRTHISISCNCWRISRPGQLVTSTLGFPTVGNKLISPGAPLWEFPFLPIHSPCTSRIAHHTGELRFYSVPKLEQFAVSRPDSVLTSIAFTPDGTLLFAGGFHGAL